MLVGWYEGIKISASKNIAPATRNVSWRTLPNPECSLENRKTGQINKKNESRLVVVYPPMHWAQTTAMNSCVCLWKKRSEETQTLCSGCSKTGPKISPRHRPLPRGAGRPKFYQLEMKLYLQTQFGEDTCTDRTDYNTLRRS